VAIESRHKCPKDCGRRLPLASCRL
jgi:hypothetical protein